MTKSYCWRGRRKLHPEYARWGCTSELFSICYVQMNGNLLRERKNNCKHLCLVHAYKKNKSALRKLVHCPTKREGTWQALPLILSLFRWLLPSFSSCSWFLLFLGSVHQEAFNSLKMDGKTVAAGKRLVPSCKPSLVVTLLQKHESHSCPFAEHEHIPHYNFKKRSAPPSVNQGVSGHNGCWESWWCPNLAYCV